MTKDPDYHQVVDVSIIIVNWNTRQLLVDCIDSLFAETNQCTMEIIVVDNGSTDGSVEAVRTLFPRVKLILNGENLGFAKANNIGIRQSSGKFVCLVNSDTKALDGCVDRLYAYMCGHPAVGASGPKTVSGNLTFRLNCRQFPSLWKIFCEASMLARILPGFACFRGRLITDIDQNTIRSIDVLSGCFFMIRREAFSQVGLLDERFYIYGEDRDWCKRLHNAGWDVVFYPAAQAIHYGGVSSAAAPLKFQLELIKSDFLYWEKHHSLVARVVFCILTISSYSVRAFFLLSIGVFKKEKIKAYEIFLKNIKCVNWIIKNKILFFIKF